MPDFRTALKLASFAVPDEVRVVRDLRRQGEPQFKHQAEVFLPNLGKKFSGDQRIKIQQRLISLSPIVSIKVDTEQGPSKNSHYYYFKDDDCAPYTMSFREYQDGLTLDYFLEWRKLMINEDGTYNPPDHYKKIVVIHLTNNQAGKRIGLAEEGEPKYIGLVGSFPDSLQYGEIDYNSSEPQTLEVNVTYDGPKWSPGLKTTFDATKQGYGY